MKQQDISLKTENTELGKKLTEYQSRINEMQNQLYDVQQSSDEMASTMYNHVENLQKEVTENELMLGQEWNSTIVQIIEAVGKLDDDSLGYVEESEISVQDNGKLLNPINPNTYKTLIEAANTPQGVKMLFKKVEDLIQKQIASVTAPQTSGEDNSAN